MGIEIRQYTSEWIPAVVAFNGRLAAGGVAPEFRFPESDVPAWLPRLEGRRIYQEFYLATEGAEVRGGYILKFQDFSFAGEVRPLAYYHLPLSEGIVDKAYSRVGVHMLRSAVKMQPRLFCLGMGGFDRPLPQMLKALGWHLHEVPFYFRVRSAARFLRQVVPLRGTLARRILSDAAAFTGAGPMGIHLLQRVRRRRADRSVTAEVVSSFDRWADDVWERSHRRYPLIGVRDCATLKVLYPEEKPFVRLKISRGGEVIGWASLLDTQMSGSKYFGNLRVGSIVDCLAAPEDALAIVHAASECLEARGADLVVCNQDHAAWVGSLRSAGFLAGPSNFIFAASKPLQEQMPGLDSPDGHPFLMRGDGDGPVNL